MFSEEVVQYLRLSISCLFFFLIFNAGVTKSTSCAAVHILARQIVTLPSLRKKRLKPGWRE